MNSGHRRHRHRCQGAAACKPVNHADDQWTPRDGERSDVKVICGTSRVPVLEEAVCVHALRPGAPDRPCRTQCAQPQADQHHTNSRLEDLCHALRHADANEREPAPYNQQGERVPEPP